MDRNYIEEAFKELDQLNEEVFDFDDTGIDELSDFMDKDDDGDILRDLEVIDDSETSQEVVDDKAEDHEYIGNAILKCNVCASMVFRPIDEVEVDEETQVVNKDDECPYCHTSGDGFTIIGKVEEFEEDDKDEDEEEISDEEETSDDKDITEPLLKEGIEDLSLTTDDGTEMSMTTGEDGEITIKTKHDDNNDKEMVVGEFDRDDIVDETDEDNDNETEKPAEHDEDEETVVDVDFDSMSNESFDNVVESYLHNVYDNATKFKTTGISSNGKQITVEGLIKFDSGNKKKTSFILEARETNGKGKVRFICENKHITNSKNPYTLTCSVVNKNLVCESLSYNYRINGTRVCGTVRRK